jgi:Flp pilus assembly protein TadD
MDNRWFWKSWTKEYKFIGVGIALLLFTSILFMWLNYIIGIDAVITWQKIYDQKPVETIAHAFQVGHFEFYVPIESYLTFEYFNGGQINPNVTASYVFLIVIILSSLVLVSVISTFKRFWYFVGMGLFILFIVSLRLEVLRLFGAFNQWTTLGVIILYVALSFLFNSLSHIKFVARLLSFTLLTTLVGIVIFFFSNVQYPFLHLAVTSYTPGLVLSLLFMVMVAHEILASFVYLTSQGSTTSKSLNHFLIISVIYLANLMLLYLHEAKIIEWDFLYINVYLLLMISAILGIWGYRHREQLYQHITYFNPFGAYFIIALACITFSTIGLSLGSANDPSLKVIRDFIIYSHLGFGLIFMLYFFSNFMIMMAENLNVYKVLYTPNRMPYITYRIAGFIAMLAFVFYSNWREYVYHSVSGFYNHLGDLYTLMDKSVFAEAYYQQGRQYGFQNHRSNYILAGIEVNRNNFEQAHYHYGLASAKRPSAFSMINDGNLYLAENKLFKAIFAFRNAAQEFPSSGIAKNNLGYAYTKIHLVDSALMMFEVARSQSKTKDAAEINFAAFLAQEYLPIKGDSLTRLFNSQSKGVASNALVIATTQHQNFNTDVTVLKQGKLNLFEATLLNNYVVNKVKELDTTFINQAYAIATDSLNLDYREALKASLAYAYYHRGNVTKALEILGELAYLTQSRQGKYNYVMGLWALEQGDAELAAQSFDYAVEYSYKEAKVYRAIALVEARQLTKAIIAADTLINSKIEEEKQIGKQLKTILTASPADVLPLADDMKYQYSRYRLSLHDSTTFNRIISSIQDANLKAQALLDISKRHFNAGNTIKAIRYFNKLDGLTLSNKKLFDDMQHFELELLASRGQLRLLAEKINEGIEFNRAQSLEKLLYTALLSEASGDTLTAEKNYKVLATYNPFFEEGIIAAARYFKKHSADPMKAYNILTDAIHINRKSIRLLNAYIAEAVRMGFDKYAADADEALREISR